MKLRARRVDDVELRDDTVVDVLIVLNWIAQVEDGWFGGDADWGKHGWQEETRLTENYLSLWYWILSLIYV